VATREGLDPVRTWTGKRQEVQRGVDQLDLGLDDLGSDDSGLDDSGLDRQPRIWITLAPDWTAADWTGRTGACPRTQTIAKARFLTVTA
jgi:hypothetical protein